MTYRVQDAIPSFLGLSRNDLILSHVDRRLAYTTASLHHYDAATKRVGGRGSHLVGDVTVGGRNTKEKQCCIAQEPNAKIFHLKLALPPTIGLCVAYGSISPRTCFEPNCTMLQQAIQNNCRSND
jgi:hypothetical protein